MDFIDYLNIFLKYTAINLFSCFIFTKIINFKDFSKKNVLLAILISTSISLNYTIFGTWINPSSIIIVSYFVLSFFNYYISKTNLSYSICASLLSLSLAFILHIICIFFSVIIFVMFIQINHKNPLILLLAIIFESLIIYKLFKLKRFKNGFSFFKNNSYTLSSLIFLSGITIIIFNAIGNDNNNFITKLLFLSFVFIFISIFLWVKERFLLHYKSMITSDTIKNLQNQLNNEIILNESMKEELKNISIVNHKYSSRISALELYITKLSSSLNYSEEFANELSEASQLIKNLSNEYSNELAKSLPPINRTGIINIDNLLDYFRHNCLSNNVDFNVVIKSSVKQIINETISLNLLETLLSDIIKNATIAIKHSNNDNHKILVQFDILEHLEICIYDTGIEFQVDTFNLLGIQNITTHKDTGGSGIGFATIFEILDKTNASIIIEEYCLDNSDYSKCIIIKFDNKHDFIIRSYRYKEIKNICTNNRISLQTFY